MDTLSEALLHYRKLAGAAARMAEAARAGDWRLLPALDAECAAAVAQLKSLDVAGLSTLDRARIVVLATRIRADQHEVQQLVRPRLLQVVEKVAALHGGN